MRTALLAACLLLLVTPANAEIACDDVQTVIASLERAGATEVYTLTPGSRYRIYRYPDGAWVMVSVVGSMACVLDREPRL